MSETILWERGVDYPEQAEAVAHIASETDDTGSRRHVSVSRDPGNDNDYPTLPAWIDALEHGDPARGRMIEELSRELALPEVVGAFNQRVDWQPSRTPAGALDVPAYLAGLPEVWTEPVTSNVRAPGRTLELVTNNSTSASVHSSNPLVIAIRTSAAFALAYLLESCGQPVEVWNANSVRLRSGRVWTTRVRVKAAADVFNTPRLAAWSCTDGLRRGMFALKEYRRAIALDMGYTYGYPADIPAEKAGDVPLLATPAAAGQPWETVPGARRWIEAEFRRIALSGR